MKNNFYTRLNPDQKYILICCFVIFAVNGLYAMILGPILPLISDQYNLNNTISGSLLSAHQMGSLIAGFLAGVLPVILGRKKSIMLLCSFVIIGFTTIIITGNPLLLILSFLFTGISRGSISNFNNTVVNELSDSSPSALSFLHSVFAVGAILGPFLIIFTTSFLGDQGWRGALVVVIVLAMTALLLFSRMNIRESHKEKVKGLSYGFMKEKYFWIGAGIFFFYLSTEAAVTGWLVKYFVDSNFMTTQYAQLLSSLLWVVILIGRLTVVFIGEKISKSMILISTSIGTFFFYGLLLSSSNLLIVTISIMGLGFSMAGIYPTTVSVVGKTINEYPMAMGTLLIFGGIGSILMPTVTGLIADYLGIWAGMSAIIVGILLMIVFVIMMTLHLRKTEVA